MCWNKSIVKATWPRVILTTRLRSRRQVGSSLWLVDIVALSAHVILIQEGCYHHKEYNAWTALTWRTISSFLTLFIVGVVLCLVLQADWISFCRSISRLMALVISRCSSFCFLKVKTVTNGHLITATTWEMMMSDKRVSNLALKQRNRRAETEKKSIVGQEVLFQAVIMYQMRLTWPEKTSSKTEPWPWLESEPSLGREKRPELKVLRQLEQISKSWGQRERWWWPESVVRSRQMLEPIRTWSHPDRPTCTHG